MSSGRTGSLTSSSPFANIASDVLDEQLASDEQTLQSKQVPVEEPVDSLEDFGETGIYEDDANLDPLSALEKYCRSEMPQQRLAYAAGIGASVQLLEPYAISGTVISLLRELLGDVYADVRLTALQQILPVARRLRSAGMLYQSDLETLWDLVQPLLLDADVENQEAASVVLAELSHVVAMGNAVVASQKLVWAVQRLQRLPPELQAEGALASLRLITEVVATREGSPLKFDTIEDFSVSTLKMMSTYEGSPDVRQAVALLLPRFARHMPASLRMSLLPGLVKTLANDSHWNVRAEVPQLLVNLLLPYSQQQQQPPSAAMRISSSSSSISGRWPQAAAAAAAAAAAGHWLGGGLQHSRKAGCAAGAPVEDSLGPDEFKMFCDIVERLCRDTSVQVKVAALASLGHLLPLLPAAQVTSHRAPLLGLFASAAKPPAQLAGVKVPLALCGPRLSGHMAAMRQRHRQQQRRLLRAEREGQNSSKGHGIEDELLDLGRAFEHMVAAPGHNRDDQHPASSSSSASSDVSASGIDAAAAAEVNEQEQATGTSSRATSSSSSNTEVSASSNSSLSDTAASAASQEAADGAAAWLLGTASNTPDGEDEYEERGAAAAGIGIHGGAAAGSGVPGQQQRQQQRQQQPLKPQPQSGTAAAELPLACAFHLGKVALHIGPECWHHLQHAYLQLATEAVNGACDVAAALLLAFPDLSAALGPEHSTSILVPVVLELLHTQLEALSPVLSVMLGDIMRALPQEMRICLLQLLPSLVMQTDPELTGDWRARVAVAEQLAVVAGHVSKAQVAYCLWPLLLTLARDPVHAVRAAAAHQAGPLLLHLPEEEMPPEDADPQKAAAAEAALAGAANACEQAPQGPGAAVPTIGTESEEPAAAAASSVPGSSTSASSQGQLTGGPELPSGLSSAAAAAAEVDGDDGAAERAIVAAAATKAVRNVDRHDSNKADSSSQLQQDQQQQPGPDVLDGSGRPVGNKLHWMRRGLTSGLQQLHEGLQQGVDRVRESSSVQKALNGMDQQLIWLQQHPQGKVLWNLGSKLAQGVGMGPQEGGSSSSGGGSSQAGSSREVSLGELRHQLASLQLMDAAAWDPCRFLPTPSWSSLAAELLGLSRASSSSERQVFVLAAGSILAAHANQQQVVQEQQAEAACGSCSTLTDTLGKGNGDQHQQHQKPAAATASGLGKGDNCKQEQQQQSGRQFNELLHQLRQLAADPVPGVRCDVAVVVSSLLERDALPGDILGNNGSRDTSSSNSSSATSLHSTSTTASSTTATSSSSCSSSAVADAAAASGSSQNQRAPDADKLQDQLTAQQITSVPQQQQHGAQPGNNTVTVGSTSSRSPSAAATVLQLCLQQLQQDPCLSVADAASSKVSRHGHSSSTGPAADASGSGSGKDAGAAVAAADAAAAAAEAAVAARPPPGLHTSPAAQVAVAEASAPDTSALL